MVDFNHVRKDSLYALLAIGLAVVLYVTGQVPQLLHIPRVVYWGPRPSTAPAFLSPVVLRTLITGKYHITNALHTGPTSWGPHASVLLDQFGRLMLVVGFFLACVGTKSQFSTSRIRTPLIFGFLLGAASPLSDLLSFCIRGGVVDWIGVGAANGKAPVSLLLSPTDLLLLPAIVACIAFVVLVLWKEIERRISDRNPQLVAGQTQ